MPIDTARGMSILVRMSHARTHRRQHPPKGLEAAIKAAGSQAALARAIGRKQPSVWAWLNESGRVSAEDAVAIERATGVPAETINDALAEFARMRGIEPRAN